MERTPLLSGEDRVRRYIEAAEAELAKAKAALRSQAQAGHAHEQALAMLRDAKRRVEHFPPGLLADYRWNALLELYVAALEGRETRFTDLVNHVGASATTGRRVVDELVALDLMSLSRGGETTNRMMVSLTPDGIERMNAYFRS